VETGKAYTACMKNTPHVPLRLYLQIFGIFSLFFVFFAVHVWAQEVQRYTLQYGGKYLGDMQAKVGGSPVKLGNSVLPSGPKDNVRSSTGSSAKRASLKDLNPLPVSNMRKLLFKMAIQKESNRGGNIR
jgi:hypothetical protein